MTSDGGAITLAPEGGKKKKGGTCCAINFLREKGGELRSSRNPPIFHICTPPQGEGRRKDRHGDTRVAPARRVKWPRRKKKATGFDPPVLLLYYTKSCHSGGKKRKEKKSLATSSFILVLRGERRTLMENIAPGTTGGAGRERDREARPRYSCNPGYNKRGDGETPKLEQIPFSSA